MGNRKHVEDDKMFVARANDPEFIGTSAKQMAKQLLQKEWRGPGDTLDAAAFRLQTKYGVDAEVILQGWRREIREMKASRWLGLFRAWWASGLANVDDLYAAERSHHAEDSWVVGLADFVAGQKGEAGE